MLDFGRITKKALVVSEIGSSKVLGREKVTCENQSMTEKGICSIYVAIGKSLLQKRRGAC